MRTRLLGAFVVFLFAVPARAQVVPLPAEAGLQPIVIPGPLPLRDFGPEHSGACLRIYSNQTTATLFYAAPGANVELADDLHTTASGMQLLCAFDLAYHKPEPGAVDAIVTFYDNTAADGAPGDVLAGPFLVASLPSGTHAFHIEVPGGFVDADVWMGVKFSDGNTGLLTFAPPEQGTSHDLFWLSPPGQIGNFGGTPPADFFLGVHSTVATPASSRTWGGIKLFYR